MIDSQSNEYKLHSIGPYELTVTESAEGNGGGMTYNSQNEVNVIGQNIRGIKTDTELKSGSEHFFGSTLFTGLLSFPIVLLIALFLWGRKLKTEDKDVKGTKLRKAGKESLKD